MSILSFLQTLGNASAERHTCHFRFYKDQGTTASSMREGEVPRSSRDRENVVRRGTAM